MSDTVKVIIEIPKDIYERCKDYKLWSYDAETLEGAVAMSKPLSEVLDRIKAEIEEKPTDYCGGYIGLDKKEVLEILDKIGKAESEDKE